MCCELGGEEGQRCSFFQAFFCFFEGNFCKDANFTAVWVLKVMQQTEREGMSYRKPGEAKVIVKKQPQTCRDKREKHQISCLGRAPSLFSLLLLPLVTKTRMATTTTTTTASPVVVMRRSTLLSVVVLALGCVCTTDASAPQQQKLCSCQQEGKFMECFNEVAAECNTYGEYAIAVPFCQFDWSNPAALGLNPATFMQIIKASAVKCKHPYEFNVTEMASFLGATDMGQFKDAFISQKITGAMMTQLTLEQRNVLPAFQAAFQGELDPLRGELHGHIRRFRPLGQGHPHLDLVLIFGPPVRPVRQGPPVLRPQSHERGASVSSAERRGSPAMGLPAHEASSRPRGPRTCLVEQEQSGRGNKKEPTHVVCFSWGQRLISSYPGS